MIRSHLERRSGTVGSVYAIGNNGHRLCQVTPWTTIHPSGYTPERDAASMAIWLKERIWSKMSIS